MIDHIGAICLLFQLALIWVGVLASLDHPGFISIDCGSSSSSSYHGGLNYTSDEAYIPTGNNENVSPSFAGEDLYNTIRSFSDGARSCYALSPLKANSKYLIRARFMYGDFDGQRTAPKFDVYIGVTYWDSIEFKELDQKLAKEIIHYSDSDSIDVCLVGIGHRSPFISALELRPLDDFAYDASSHFSLKLWNRWDVGRLTASSDESDDAYNRLWSKHNWSIDFKRIQSNENFVPSHDDPYKVPSGVLATACEQSSNSRANLTYSYRTKIHNGEVYVYWHFAELHPIGANHIREFYIHVPLRNGYAFGPIRPKYLEVTTVKSGPIPLDGADIFVFSLNRTARSNLNPILNAVEMYKKLQRIFPTNQDDVDAIIEIRSKYAVLKFWQGDPCLPKTTQWDGLICNEQNPPRITSLDLKARKLSGEVPPSLFKLKSLESLNLANNGFTGKIPDSLGQMPSLTDIDLRGNNLTGPIPPHLLQRACNNSISLSLEEGVSVSDACKPTHNNKRHRFIIPLVSSIASISVLLIMGAIFFICNRPRKEGLVYQTLKSRNKGFRYSDIVKMTDNFAKTIGEGAFGSVYHGILQDGIQVAIKILNDSSSAVTLKQFCAEAELLTKIHHVNLVSLIGYCEERSNLALVYEYMSSGNLKMHLAKTNRRLNWKTRLQISIDAAQGLEYLHSGCQPMIVHMDVKPENILLDRAGRAKISDFGLSRFFTPETDATDIAGTLGYLDPDYVRLRTISDKSDVYGFGVVLLELITGKPAIIKRGTQRDQHVHVIKWTTEMFERGDIREIVDNRLRGEYSEDAAWKLLEVAMACASLISTQRPKMSEVVAHLKMCYAYEGLQEQKSLQGVGNESMF